MLAFIGSVPLTVGGTVTSSTANSILYVGAGPVLAQDNTNFKYTTASGPRLQVGSTGTSAGWILGYAAASGYASIWPSTVVPSSTNYVFRASDSQVVINTVGANDITYISKSGTELARFGGGAGIGLNITAGTATTAVSALAITQTWNNAGVTFSADTADITVTAAAVGSAVIDRKVNGGSLFRIERYAADVTASAGATVVATNLIPANSQLIGIATRVTTGLGNGSGTTGYAVGDGTDPNRWGDIVGIIAGTSSAQANATADPSGWFGAAQSVTLTAAGGNFDGTGVIRVVASVLTMKAPTS